MVKMGQIQRLEKEAKIDEPLSEHICKILKKYKDIVTNGLF